jgi:RimJ/RimL family protein N-acetyltransferase
MLDGRHVTLREIRRPDLAVLHRELSSDPVVSSISNDRPWVPVSLARQEAAFDRALTEPEDVLNVQFAVQARGDEDGTLVGTTGLWRVDPHNSTAHIGIQLLPSARGRGLGTDAVRVMCRYAFVVRGLYRVGLETLGTNHAMQGAALRAGFTEEGRIRGAAFVLGERVDDVLYGLLRSDWRDDEEGSR